MFKSKPISLKGKSFASISEACKYFGNNYARARRRIALGYSLEEAVSIKEDLREAPARDHLGQNFSSMSAMARHWGILPQTLTGRLERGWSIKDALLNPIHTEFAPKRRLA